MAATQRVRSDATPPGYGDVPEGEGWLLFAGIMLGLAGTLNVIWGIAAVSTSSFFVANARFIISDLNTWGWVVMIIGAIEIAAVVGIWTGGNLGRWVGVAVAALNSIAALLSISAYPFWSLAIFTIDILVIYGLVTYGGQRNVGPLT